MPHIVRNPGEQIKAQNKDGNHAVGSMRATRMAQQCAITTHNHVITNGLLHWHGICNIAMNAVTDGDGNKKKYRRKTK